MNNLSFIVNTLENQNLCSKQTYFREHQNTKYFTQKFVTVTQTGKKKDIEYADVYSCAQSHKFKNCTTKKLPHSFGK